MTIAIPVNLPMGEGGPTPNRKVEIARKDNIVILSIECADDYNAMLLYDETRASLADGYLAIEVMTRQ